LKESFAVVIRNQENSKQRFESIDRNIDKHDEHFAQMEENILKLEKKQHAVESPYMLTNVVHRKFGSSAEVRTFVDEIRQPPEAQRTFRG